MNEIKNAFDPKRDYMEELSKDEKYEEKGRVYPYLKGLKRLAHLHRGGLRGVHSRIVKAPSLNTTGAKGEAPDCIAAVTIAYHFLDGSVFEGSADASYKAHKAPFNKHLVATAESKAEARAIRRAFNISQVAKEEMGSSEDEDNTENDPIRDTQVEGIKRLAKRKRLSQKAVLTLLNREDLDTVEQLTQGEAMKALKLINKYKPKEPESAPTG